MECHLGVDMRRHKSLLLNTLLMPFPGVRVVGNPHSANYTYIYIKGNNMYKPNPAIRDSEDFQNIRNVMSKFEKIQEKNRCLRVQFLDWLSVKMHAWADGVKAMSDRIDSPCVIKIEPKRKIK
jgi:hypothetical protein